MLAGGISEGSIRAVDPMIASQAVMATLNAAKELRSWASVMPRARHRAPRLDPGMRAVQRPDAGGVRQPSSPRGGGAITGLTRLRGSLTLNSSSRKAPDRKASEKLISTG